MSKIVPSEDWPPYRWLWTHVVLARNFDGSPSPYTHGMRRNPVKTIASIVAVLVLVVLWNARRFWPVIVSFATGLLAGHVFW